MNAFHCLYIAVSKSGFFGGLSLLKITLEKIFIIGIRTPSYGVVMIDRGGSNAIIVKMKESNEKS